MCLHRHTSSQYNTHIDCTHALQQKQPLLKAWAIETSKSLVGQTPDQIACDNTRKASVSVNDSHYKGNSALNHFKMLF